MKRLFIMLFVAVGVIFVASAQTAGKKRSALHVSFCPPLSTHGAQAAGYSNKVSFNVLTGVSRDEECFTFGGLANIIYRNANGLQFAGLVNYVGHDGRGVLFGGLTNLVGNNYCGLQFAGLFNTATGLRGMQFAGLLNVADGMKGVLFGGLANVCGRADGFQFGGLGNIATDVSGMQFGGLFNVARRVNGVQFAGLVNVADSCDYPLALLNIIRKGEYALSIMYNETGSVMLTLRTGGRVTYGILGIGYNYKTRSNGFTTEGGFGIHINVTRWLRVNQEIKGGVCNNFSDDPTFYTNYALLPAFRLNPHFELFGGPSLNYLQSDDPANTRLFPSHSLWKRFGDSVLKQIYIGYQVGMQYIF